MAAFRLALVLLPINEDITIEKYSAIESRFILILETKCPA
jgi:hypothetical protein